MTATTATATATANTAPKSLESLVIDNAVKAIGESESAIYDAAVSLAVLMAERQADSAGADGAFDDKRNKDYFTGVLYKVAYSGVMVWRHTGHELAVIAAAPRGEKRITAAREYIARKGRFDDKKLENKDSAGNLFKPRLTDGLARLKTVSFKLMADIHANHAGLLREVMQMRKDGIAAESIVAHAKRYIGDTFGKSFATLTDNLRAAPTPAKTEAEKIDAMVKRAKDMPLESMIELVAKMQAALAVRFNDAASGADSIETGETEGETVETVAEAIAA